MTADLLPCPWCGVIESQPVDATRIMGVWRIVHRCKIIGPFSIESPTRDGVIAVWNTRAPLDGAVAALVGAAEGIADIQQDINFAANSYMDQSLCDASAFLDKLENLIAALRGIGGKP